MLATASIKSLIQAPSSDQEILDKFIELFSTYKIRYTIINNQPFFAVSNLASSKGLDTKDFSKNFFKDGKCLLAGKFWKLEGEPLISFKEAWVRDSNYAFSKARALWVCD